MGVLKFREILFYYVFMKFLKIQVKLCVEIYVYVFFGIESLKELFIFKEICDL